MVALGRIVLTRREHVVMLEPFDKGLVATTLRYAYEVRDTKDYFEDIPDIKLPAEMREIAMQIIDTKADQLEPHTFTSHSEKASDDIESTKTAGRRREHRRE